uniref:GP3 protein n=1 Tax=Free State vervet virus TaxID=1737586 RepID=A0A162L8T1_9NIDO|nr:GP3 protein [Free State vervet virus]
MGLNSVFGVLTLSSLLCCVYSYCFVFPDPDIHIQVFLNYTTCHMQGQITAGYQALGACNSFKHDQFSGAYGPLNLNYSTSAPVGAVILGLSLLNRIHQNCSWSGSKYCCSQHSPQEFALVTQPLPHLVILGGGALISGIMSACLAVQKRYTTFLS